MKIRVEGVEDVLSDLERLKEKIRRVTPAIVKEVAERGEDLARTEYGSHVGNVDSGDLYHGITSIVEGKHAEIISPVWYTKFVEYGTGIVGYWQHGHDVPSGWIHDSHDHGDKGWTYFKSGKFHWTAGAPGRPFMWYTWVDITQQVNDICHDNWVHFWW